MSAPFVAEVRILPYTFAPTGWATCDGQLLPLSQNTALFSLLGTVYGGNGKSNFALPDLQGMVPLGPGAGGGLSEYDEGQQGGSETVTLIDSEMPVHSHAMFGYNDFGNSPNPQNNALANYGTKTYLPAPVQQPQLMAFQTLSVAGSSFPHNNNQPYLTLQYCIALQGVFPPRS